MTHKNPALLPHTTWGDAIKANAGRDNVGLTEQMKAAIEGDKRARARSEALHPLKDYPYRPNFGYPIDPSA